MIKSNHFKKCQCISIVSVISCDDLVFILNTLKSSLRNRGPVKQYRKKWMVLLVYWNMLAMAHRSWSSAVVWSVAPYNTYGYTIRYITMGNVNTRNTQFVVNNMVVTLGTFLWFWWPLCPSEWWMTFSLCVEWLWSWLCDATRLCAMKRCLMIKMLAMIIIVNGTILNMQKSIQGQVNSVKSLTWVHDNSPSCIS